MKIMITGAAGFIGTHLTRYCLEQGHEVIALDNNWPENKIDHPLLKDIHPMLRWVDCDIKDKLHLDHLFGALQPEVCYHLAAYASEGRSNHIRSFIHSNNTVGTAKVINACVNHKCKLVFTSSVAVYSGVPPFDEETNPNPIDEYGLSKYMSERSIVIAGDTQDLDWCIIRPRNVYGPGQNMWDRSRNLFGIWMYNALHDIPLTIFGDGSNMRSFTYIDDIIPCLYRAKDVINDIINLGSGTAWWISEAAAIFSKVTGYTNIVYSEARHEVKQATCAIGKSEQYLGFNGHTSLGEGLKKMWEWAKQQPERPLDEMPKLEVEVNAHSSLKP